MGEDTSLGKVGKGNEIGERCMLEGYCSYWGEPLGCCGRWWAGNGGGG